MMAKNVLFCLAACLLSSYEILAQSCALENPCLCMFDNGEVVNLWPLNNTLYNATSGNITYYWSVCEDRNGPGKVGCGFKNANGTEVTCPEKFSLCKCDRAKNESSSLGSVKDRKVVDRSGAGGEKFVFSFEKSSVALICTDSIASYFFAANGNDQLLMFSNHICPHLEATGLSIGTKLIIILFVFLTTYFVLGALLLRFVRGARGIEIIPNFEFWRDLPYLVRDGIIFLLSGCKSTTLVTSEVYDRI